MSNYRLDFGKSLAIGVYADDEDSIIDPEAFKVFVNGVHEPSLTVSGSTPNYSLTWMPEKLGLYSIRVLGASVDGMVANSRNLEVEVVNDNPNEIEIYGFDSNLTTNFPNFASGSTIYVPFRIVSNFGTITSVKIYDNNIEAGSLGQGQINGTNIFYDASRDQYIAQVTPTYDGNHSIYLSVDFEEGTSAFTNPFFVEITEGIDGDQLPSVTLRQPLDGLSITDVSTIRFEANATDPDGFITQVEFYVNGELNATVDYNASYPQATFGYGSDWSPDTNSPDANGTYRIYAVAVDNGGNRVMSDVATITVVPGSDPPVVLLNDLISNSYEGQPMYLFADVEDNASTGGDGLIQSVSFYVNGVQVGPTLTDPPYQAVWFP